MVRAHVFVLGRVQGVFYRTYTQQQAQQLDLTGWVRNREPEFDLRQTRYTAAPAAKRQACLPNRQVVEAVFEGAKEKVEKIVEWCWEGSPGAQVKDVKVEWSKASGEFDGFEIRR